MNEPLAVRASALLRRHPAGARVLDARLRVSRAVLARRHRWGDARRLRTLARTDDGLRLNVGAGGHLLPGWTSVDLLRDRTGEVLQLDATAPWPFPPGSLAAVNSEHFIEHLSLGQARAYVREAFTALRPGGVIRTSTPDLEGLVAAYLAGEPAVLAEHHRHGYRARVHADLVNNHFYMHGHRHIHDLASLRALLEEAGFKRVTRASFGESEHEVLRGIDYHDLGSLHALAIAVDAVKPPA